MLAAALLGVVGCSLLVDAERKQCRTDADCLERGDAFMGSVCLNSACVSDPKWACVDESAEEPSGEGSYQVQLQLVDLVTRAPLSGVKAELCRKIDVDCATPIGDAVTSNRHGIVSFSGVEAGFDGYVSLESDGLLPSLYFLNPPVSADVTIAPVLLASPAEELQLIQQGGGTQQDGRGIVVITADDCQQTPASGVAFSVSNADTSTQAFYSVDGLPTTSVSATDDSGYGGLLDVEPGTVALTGTLAASGREVSRASVLVRANTLTYTQLVPLGK